MALCCMMSVSLPLCVYNNVYLAQLYMRLSGCACISAFRLFLSLASLVFVSSLFVSRVSLVFSPCLSVSSLSHSLSLSLFWSALSLSPPLLVSLPVYLSWSLHLCSSVCLVFSLH